MNIILKIILFINLLVGLTESTAKFVKMQDLNVGCLTFKSVIKSNYDIIVGCNNGDLSVFSFNGS